MPRPEKVQAVAEIRERMERAQAVFLAEYAGLSVKDQQRLRRSLRAGGAEFKVVKMTLARRAAAELELEGVDDLLLGPTGLTFADGDPVTAAKALKDFAKDHEVFSIKGGLLGTDLLTPERVSELAEIEPRDVLLAKIAGAAKAPITKLAGLLGAMPRNLASMLSQLIEKRDQAEPRAPVEAAPAEEVETVAAEESPADSTAIEADAPAAVEEAAEEAVEEATVAAAAAGSESEKSDDAPVETEAPAEDAVATADDVVETAESDGPEEKDSVPEPEAVTSDGAEDDETADADAPAEEE